MNDSSEWIEFLSEFKETDLQKNPLCDSIVDFSKFQVIVVVDQVRNTTGYFVDLRIIQNEDRRFIVPFYGNNEIFSGDALTQPHIIVKTERTELPLIFE
ncbi:MAG: hypothetical protein ACJA0X_002370 [Cyclobacteriaceae bacterium]